ncbi:MAG TPA: recombinase family protein [Bryobacteraceae bacterium]|nr:recombinase family protein [Bryobacteraceae bacterium]
MLTRRQERTVLADDRSVGLHGLQDLPPFAKRRCGKRQKMGDKPSVDGPVIAAQYIRMSTEQQQYSLDNQSDAIRAYAEQRNMTIVRTYSDAGKTGLTLSQRPGLKQLIEDAERGTPGYSAVLVYDVSRWGRFQDADESAYYEYRCRRAKISVHYCAELFPNDGSITTALLKALKRAMAAEYSRELSVKVFAGQARLTELGFRQGGLAGYGLRRLLVGPDRSPKFVLQSGEEKSIATDRVVLIPGPVEEIEIVREIFRLYTSKLYSPADIARMLNERGVPWVGNRPWTRYVIRDMVTNPKYIGSNVSNRLSGKLRTLRTKNPPEMWIRLDNAFEAIVEPSVFKKAETVVAARGHLLTDEYLLQALRDYLRRNGRLTARSIIADPDMPCAQAYNARFGGLMEAYRKIGYQPERNLAYVDRDRMLLPIRRRFTAMILDGLRRLGVSAMQDSRTKLLQVNGNLTVRCVVARCRPLGQSHGWLLRLHSPTKADATVIARLTSGNEELFDYFCLPRQESRRLKQLTLRPRTQSNIDRYRSDDLTFLKKLARRSKAKPRRTNS